MRDACMRGSPPLLSEAWTATRLPSRYCYSTSGEKSCRAGWNQARKSRAATHNPKPQRRVTEASASLVRSAGV